MFTNHYGVLRHAVQTTDGRILEGWARARTSEGIHYYLNHKHSITQWDHPEFIRILEEMPPINTVKYAAYRTACKLRHLQTRLKIRDVSLQCITSAFDCAGLRAAENSDIVPVKDIERVILYIFRTSNKNKSIDSGLSTDLMMNLILNTYDENRSGNIQVFKCKVIMVVMCGGRLQEKYRYLFNQIADHNNCCTRRRLAKLLHHLADITELLSEQLSFGTALVGAAVDSCFKEIEGDIGITEDAFLTWLVQEPQTLVWWTTLYRLSSAELVCHDVKCGACKMRPIIGLRYQCLKCLGYNLCQDCFLHGRKSKNHKLSHPIQEYCHESTGKEWRKSLLQILRHRLSKCNDLKPRYLTISVDSARSFGSLLQDTDDEALRQEASRSTLTDASSSGGCDDDDAALMMSRTICQSVEDLDKLDGEDEDSSGASEDGKGAGGAEPLIRPSSPRQQIHSVIRHLQDGQRQLSNGLEDEKNPARISTRLVEEHTAELQTQINRLKNILETYSSSGKPVFRPSQVERLSKAFPRMESTPIVGDRGLHLSLSPIGTQASHNDTALLDNKENHFTEIQKVNGLISSTLHSNLSFDRAPPERVSLSTISENDRSKEDPLVAPPEDHAPRLRKLNNSFTETEWPSSMMSSSSTRTSSLAPPSSFEGSVTSRQEGEDTLVEEAKEDLERVLTNLEEMFPFSRGQGRWLPGTRPVVTAAFEIGDAVVNYVNRVPLGYDLEETEEEVGA